MRKDAIERSKSTILGNVYEKIVPILWDFPYHPKDMVFIWKWVDYLILKGLSEGELEEIIFLEVKTGTSRLNKNEQKIKSVIRAKKISYIEWRSKEL
jgi:predicted Holliday junction resolvase-like endonuclease